MACGKSDARIIMCMFTVVYSLPVADRIAVKVEMARERDGIMRTGV